MLIFPAIDLMNGQVVRLRQGKAEEKTVYSDDPVAFAVGAEEFDLGCEDGGGNFDTVPDGRGDTRCGGGAACV